MSSAPAPGEPGRLIYAGGDSVHAGQIIVIGVGSATPYGFLGRATSVTVRNGQTVVSTKPTSLLEVASQGSIDATLSASEVPAARAAAAKAFSCTGSASATITASASFGTSVAFKASWQGGGLQSASLSATASANESLSADLEAALSCALEQTKLAQFAGPTKVVFVGYVPVVLTSLITIYLDANASANAAVTDTSVGAGFSATAGIGWTKTGGFSPIEAFSPQLTFTPPKLTANADVAGNLTPTLDVLMYGVAGPEIALKAGLDLAADTTANPWWTLTAPVDLTASLTIPALDLSSPALDVYKHGFLLDQAPSRLTLSPKSSSISSGGSQTYAVEGLDTDGKDLGPDTNATLTISPDGSCSGYTCTPASPGQHTVTATDHNATGYADLTVTSPPGTWTATAAPLPGNAVASGANPSINSVACSTAICVASGTYLNSSYVQDAALWTESGGTWSAVEAPRPANAGTIPDLSVESVACSDNSCMAWGSYTDNTGNSEVGLWSESGGTWSATEAPPPSNIRSGYYASSINGGCSASTCVVTGEYLDAVAYEQDPAAWTESGGAWTVSELPAPANEITSDGIPNGNYGGGPVTCSPSICVAYGRYETPDDGSGAYPYVLWTDSGGRWTAAETPLPADHGDPGPGGTISVVNSVVCFIDACYAQGYYYNNGGGDTPTYWSSSDGNWTVTAAPSPSNGGTADPVTETSSNACSSQACLGVAGSVLWAELGGTWTSYTPPAPTNASTANPSPQISDAVGCFADACLGTGSYNDASGNRNAVLWLDSGGTWTTTEAPLPADGSANGTTTIDSVACSATLCVASGSYSESAGSGAALWTGPIS